MKLGNLVKIKGGKRLPKDTNLVTKRTNHPYIRVRDLGKKYLPDDGLEFVPDDVFPQISRYIVETGDVIISIVGTIGLVAYIDDRFHLASLTENCAKLTGLNQDDAEYLYYFLSSPIGISEIQKGTVGAVQAKLPLYSIADIDVVWPDKPIRSSITNTLSALDEKISVNEKLNETLESIARTIFQSWFVDFDPVKAKLAAKRNGRDPEKACMAALSGKLRIAPGKPKAERLDEKLPSADELDASIAALETLSEEQQQQLAQTAAHFPDDFEENEVGLIPTGWKLKAFSDFCEINPKRTLKKGTITQYLDMKSVPTSGPSVDGTIDREFGSGTKFINGDTLLARITPCLENGKTAFVNFLEEEQVGWGSTEFIVIRPKTVTPAIGYFYARSDDLRNHAIANMVGTSGRQRVPADCFDNLLISIPEELDLLNIFGETAEHTLQLIRSNSHQSHTLAELRDALLPKLLSGEIQIQPN